MKVYWSFGCFFRSRRCVLRREFFGRYRRERPLRLGGTQKAAHAGQRDWGRTFYWPGLSCLGVRE